MITSGPRVAGRIRLHPIDTAGQVIIFFFKNPNQPLLLQKLTQIRQNLTLGRWQKSGRALGWRPESAAFFDPVFWPWIVRKLTFGPLSLVRSGLSHVIINFGEKLVWIKIELACICCTWLTSLTYFTGPKVGPPMSQNRGHFCICLNGTWLLQ